MQRRAVGPLVQDERSTVPLRGKATEERTPPEVGRRVKQRASHKLGPTSHTPCRAQSDRALIIMKRLFQLAVRTYLRCCSRAIQVGLVCCAVAFKLGLRLVCCAWMLFVLPHAVAVDLVVDSLRFKLPVTVWNIVNLGRVVAAHVWALYVFWILLRAPVQETEQAVCLLQTPNATAWELAQNVVVTSLWSMRTCLRLVGLALTSLSSSSWVTYLVLVGFSVGCYKRT